ncbi:hypothetical protein RIF29_37222 [Crotalaria pallida]|uniref:J domain-containing protein n=1 Tax=Crotalaria pallida TaxID=3830 RepID=A0AAN9HW74_CROPI
MESVSHSRQPNKLPIPLSTKTLYDDVYGGPPLPPKFPAASDLSPRFEDYAEIFGSFHTPRASSIPVLDLPLVHQTDSFFDPRSSSFSYTEVFGALDFAVSYKDLFGQSSGFDGVSSEESWSPAETDSFSGESDHYVNNQSMPNGDLFQAVDGRTEFNVSYHKVNGTTNEHMLKGKTYMNHLHVVPGFTQVYDEPTRLNRNDPYFQVTDDIDLDMEFSADKVKGNHPRKTVQHLQNFTSGEQTFGSDQNLHSGCNRNGSHSSEMFITVSDISLRSMPSQVPPPSRPPPALDAKKGNSCGFLSNSGQVASEVTTGDSSPSFFDVEVNMNSSAAPYAAAMPEAVHGAEEKVRGTKELQERKIGAYESCVKSSYDLENNDAKMTKNMTRLNSFNDGTMQETNDRKLSKMEISVTDERQTFRKASKEILDLLEGKISLNTLEVKHTKESRSFQESDRSTGAGIRKEETELFELVGTDEFGKVSQPMKHTKFVVPDTRTHERDRKEREVSNNMQKLYKNVKAIEDDTEEKEACRREEIEKTLEGYSENEESEKGLKHALLWEENEKQFKEDFELEVNEIRTKEVFRRRENDERENWAYERDQNQNIVKEVCDGYGEINRLKEAGDNEGIQKVLNQAPEKEWNGGILNEAQREEEIESSSNQIFDRDECVKASNEDSYLEQSESMEKKVGRMEKDAGLDKGLDEMKGNEEGENVKFARAIDETWEIVGDEKLRAPEMTPGDSEHSVYHPGKVDEHVKKADDRRSTEAAEPATVLEPENVHKAAQWLHVGQSTERKEKSINETPATVVKDDAERVKREIESEKNRLRKIEEERDREREREKDRMAVDKVTLEAERERKREKGRMAVDRATFEARDRAYAEACERAERAAFERATVEARQRALAEARERLEKACAEARSYADKATTEARLKAERAALERATAEAQGHAMEKLKVERAAFVSRERLERSVSDIFGVCSSDMLDSPIQNFSSSMGSKYPYSLYGASSFSERSEREGESAQRCRARLERHRRTAERAAKALAEKNMRDLLAQKEQAERNRLSETLDAEVRRWSSGKQGNLRALLSTLQYILGPDCGWQPIPLTEVITSAAVKKAYRKATLCVHPDKLQQRGASIHHKYICEKVFDLLKEAWNQFNSEER